MTTASPKETFQKITVEVPKSLLSAAQEETGKGITQTVTAGLEKLKASRAYKNLLALEGQVDLGIDLDELREDRSFE
jgi:hypothetical protein